MRTVNLTLYYISLIFRPSQLLCMGLISMLMLTHTHAQDKPNKKEAQPISMLNIDYRGLIPMGIMADRFGYTSVFGAGYQHKTASNWYYGIEIGAMAGGKVKEDSIIDHLLTPAGFLITDDGILTVPRIQPAGLMIPITVGKIFPLSADRPNSGIYVEVGTQFFQHKILIDAIGGKVPALDRIGKRSYDRKTNGIGFKQGIGYRYFGDNRLLSFAVGFDFSQNITRNRREINVDTGISETDHRLDMLSGFRASWTVPIYRNANPKKKVFYFD